MYGKPVQFDAGMVVLVNDAGGCTCVCVRKREKETDNLAVVHGHS